MRLGGGELRTPGRRRPAPPPPAAGPSSRSVGHAFYAEEARRALGITPAWLSAARLDELPRPVFQGLVAAGVSGLCVVVRPQAVGYAPSVLLDAALAAVCCIAIVLQARLTAAASRPGAEAAIFPAAALLALDVAVAGTDSWVSGAVAVVGCALLVAIVPHLDVLRRAGHEGWAVRLGLDVGGIVAAVPLALCAAAPGVPVPVRLAVVAAGCGALCLDFLGSEERRLGLTRVRAATLVGAATALSTLAAAHASSQAAGAAAVLLLWYGLRGVSLVTSTEPRRLVPLLEYCLFVLAAGAVLIGGRLPGS